MFFDNLGQGFFFVINVRSGQFSLGKIIDLKKTIKCIIVLTKLEAVNIKKAIFLILNQ